MRKKNKDQPIHLDILKSGSNYVGYFRSTFIEDGKHKHKTTGKITGKTLEELKTVQFALQGNAVPIHHINAPKIFDSREYGASYSILALAKELELDKAIYSKPELDWVKSVMAMIVGRIVYAGSKLSLSNEWKNTALWELCGAEGKVDVDKYCYEPMDYLIERQEAIQAALAKKHLKEGVLILYDITSSYFEGEYEYSEIVKFGYNRDGKKGHEQMVIGLICSPDGCPVGVEVFPGNTKDATTVENKIKEIQEKYRIQNIIFVGDRGMITHANLEKVKGLEGLKTIGALTHPEIRDLLNRKVIEMGLFDERNIVEVIDSDNPNIRYCLCLNPDVKEKEGKTRRALLERTKNELEKIAASPRKSDAEKIGARVGKVLGKTRMGKFVNWSVTDEKLEWSFDNEKIRAEKRIDGCYIITTDVSKELMKAQEVVKSYKNLMKVEQAFRTMKTVQLEIRPVYHKKDERIRCHVFICMLAYYLVWNMKQRLDDLFKQDGKGKNREWTFDGVIERLKSIRVEKIEINGAVGKITTSPDADQEKIFDLLGVKL
jgi:transposase